MGIRSSLRVGPRPGDGPGRPAERGVLGRDAGDSDGQAAVVPNRSAPRRPAAGRNDGHSRRALPQRPVGTPLEPERLDVPHACTGSASKRRGSFGGLAVHDAARAQGGRQDPNGRLACQPRTAEAVDQPGCAVADAAIHPGRAVREAYTIRGAKPPRAPRQADADSQPPKDRTP